MAGGGRINQGNIDPYVIDVAAGTYAANGDIDFGAMKFDRSGNPNGVGPIAGREDAQPYLSLAVQRDAFLAADSGEPDLRDRCELRDEKIDLGQSVLYSFEMRIEDDFPIVDARFVCAQLKAPFYDNNASPMVALRIDRGRYIATVEHLYLPKHAPIVSGSEQSEYLTWRSGPADDALGPRAFVHHTFPNAAGDYSELQIRALIATDGEMLQPHLERDFLYVTSGVTVTPYANLPPEPQKWCGFRIGVAPNKQAEQDGIVEILTYNPDSGDERLVVRIEGEFGHWGAQDPALAATANKDARHQYFKIGPYRDKLAIWGGERAGIRVRNIRREPWERGVRLRDSLFIS